MSVPCATVKLLCWQHSCCNECYLCCVIKQPQQGDHLAYCNAQREAENAEGVPHVFVMSSLATC
eukprot:674755-Amphidinium_carterae.1